MYIHIYIYTYTFKVRDLSCIVETPTETPALAFFEVGDTEFIRILFILLCMVNYLAILISSFDRG